MTKNISQKDWEALSSYLDDQLSAKQRARLEARLQSSSELRTALKELQVTRAIIRSEPKLRAPRNFTLTPEMVGKRSKAPRYALAFQYAAVFVSVLFVFIFIADLFVSAARFQSQPRFFSQAEMGVQSMPTAAIVEMEVDADVVEEEMVTIISTEEVEARAELQVTPAEEETQVATQSVEVLEAEIVGGVATQEVVPQIQLATQTPSMEETPRPEAKTLEEIPASPQAMQETAVETTFEMPTSTVAPVPTISMEVTTAAPSFIARLLSGVSTVRILEFLIAMIAVCMWVAVWYLRRR